MSDGHPILRSVELQVLDRHHLDFRLLQRNTNDAIPALLRCYGNIVRELRNGTIPKDNDDAKWQTASEGLRGMAHCFRWIRSCCPRNVIVPSPKPDVFLAEALDLLRWGVKYDPLYNQHTAYSRSVNGNRFVDAVVDELEKTITFTPNQTPHPQFFASQIEAKKAEDARQAALYPEEQFGQLSASWYQSIQPHRAGFRFDDSTIISSGALDVATKWLRSSCLPECADDIRLGTFTAGSLRCILATLHVASLFRVKLENVSDQNHDTPQRVQTHVLSWRMDELIEWLHHLTNVPQTEISSIVSMLTFDTEPPRVTVAHKPLILGSDNRVFFLPRLFLDLPLSPMIVRTLNLTQTNKRNYDGASTSIEQAVVRCIAGNVCTGPLADTSVVTERTFQLPNGRKITPDLVLRSGDETEVLVVDVKNATPPFGTGDVVNHLKEWSGKWQPQLSSYLDAFRSHPEILSQHFTASPCTSPRVWGLLLLRWPFPVPMDIPSDMVAIDWPTFHAYLTADTGTRSMAELHAWIQERPDCSWAGALQWKQKQINVGDWTYRYSVLSLAGTRPKT